MPYIKDRIQRMLLNSLVTKFLEHGDIEGRLNYFIFKLCLEYLKKHGESYHNYSEFINEIERVRTELSNCIHEIRRRKLDKYEDLKILENGDVE